MPTSNKQSFSQSRAEDPLNYVRKLYAPMAQVPACPVVFGRASRGLDHAQGIRLLHSIHTHTSEKLAKQIGEAANGGLSDARGARCGPKWQQQLARRTPRGQGIPKGTQRGSRESSRDPNGRQYAQKQVKEIPKAPQRHPSGSQGAPKGTQNDILGDPLAPERFPGAPSEKPGEKHNIKI